MICAYFSAFLAKNCAYICAYFLHFSVHTGCLMKNASTHNFFIYYPISMNKKTEDMFFHALRSSHKIIIFFALFSVANDSQLFFLWTHAVFLAPVW
jgi:hypothetical protein